MGMSPADILQLTETLRAKVAEIGSGDLAEVIALIEAEILRRDLERN